MPAASKRHRSDTVDETDEQLITRLVRDSRHISTLQPEQDEMDEFIGEWLEKNHIQMNAQRRRGFRRRARARMGSDTDYSRVILPKWCCREIFLILVPPTMLVHQPRPFMFRRVSQYENFITAGGLQRPHPGTPPPKGFYTRCALGFDINSIESYNKTSSPQPQPSMCNVIEVSKILYQLNPDRKFLDGQSIFESWQAKQTSDINFIQRSITMSISYVAYVILHASPKIRSAIPMRVVSGASPPTRQTDKYVAENWAIFLTFDCDDTNTVSTLLPIQMEMTGGVAQPSIRLHAASTTISWTEGPMHKESLDKFKQRPMMRCLDVDFFGRKGLLTDGPGAWRPRQYQTCWQLGPLGLPEKLRIDYSAITASSSKQTNFFLYSDIKMMVDRFVNIAHSVPTEPRPKILRRAVNFQVMATKTSQRHKLRTKIDKNNIYMDSQRKRGFYKQAQD